MSDIPNVRAYMDGYGFLHGDKIGPNLKPVNIIPHEPPEPEPAKAGPWFKRMAKSEGIPISLWGEDRCDGRCVDENWRWPMEKD